MPQQPPHEASAPSSFAAAKVGAIGLTCLLAAACLGFSSWLHHAEPDGKPRTSLKLPANRGLFTGWDKQKPELVFFLTAEGHGYLLPCGCSKPQKGGLERRYNLIQILRDKGWPVVALDLGDLAQKNSPVPSLPNLQQLSKYKYAMQSLKEMNYSAVGLGPIEMENLFKIYGAYPLQDDKPRVLAANLSNRDDKFPGGFGDWLEVKPEGSKLTVGVTSIAGASVLEKAPKGGPEFDFGGKALADLQPKAKKADLRVLLYEGYLDRGKDNKPEAIAVAEAFPEYQIVVALSGEMDEPPGVPTKVPHKDGKGESIIVRLGHKSKYVGVVGVFKSDKSGVPFELKYQLVEVGEEYITPKAEQKDHPILKLMEDYAAELKSENYLAKYAQRKHPMQVAFPGNKKPGFAGTDACTSCHAEAYQVWSGSKHAEAYATLVDAEQERKPSNRQYDPECIVCHTVGFGYDSGFTEAAKTPLLKNVGCESCHGPCSEHVAHHKDAAWYPVINPWKQLPEAKQAAQIEQMCIKCHDLENDVNWKGPGVFAEKWHKVEHYKTPKKKLEDKVSDQK